MPKGRLEAFSDGVLAIIITIMVLGITAPDGSSLKDLEALVPAMVSYAVSFVGVGTYWANHHHLLNLVSKVNGRILWANLFFLFVISFFPVATDWIQKTHFASVPTFIYILLNLAVSLAYMNLERVIRHAISCQRSLHGLQELEKRSLAKERATLALEVIGLVLTFVLPTGHMGLLAVSLAFALWVVPDLRIVAFLDKIAAADEEQEISDQTSASTSASTGQLPVSSSQEPASPSQP